MLTGYLDVKDSINPNLFYTVSMAGKYRLSGVIKFELYRAILVNDPEDTTLIYHFELSAMDTLLHANLAGNNEGAIEFKDFVTTYVTTTPDSFKYIIRSCDGFGPDSLTWEMFETGYWLIHSQRTIFDDSELTSGRYRLRNLTSITIK